MRTEIVRLERYPGGSVLHWYLQGLNVFVYNRVECPIEERPEVVFMTDLTSRLDCTTHVSSLALKDRASSPEEMFGAADGPTPYFRSRVGYNDHFYDLNVWRSWDSCIFSHVGPLFWQALLREDGDLNEMIGSHGFAFYVNPISEDATELKRLLAAPFPGEGENEWLEAVCEACALVVTVGHDGQFFEIYTRDSDNLQLIMPSMQAAVKSVEESAWFQAHKAEFEWNGEYNWLCLTLPA